MSESPDSFYSSLPVQNDFTDITEPALFTDVPEGWHVIIADVEGSTVAIGEGRYKDVNFIGASCIVAALNAIKSFAIEIPFVFGGDGATILVPDNALNLVTDALVATQQLARDGFALKLRVGSISIFELRKMGQSLKVAKFKISKHFAQAMFIGGGLSFAEKLIKEGDRYNLRSTLSAPQADYQGLECRWQDVSNALGETHSLIVVAHTAEPLERCRIYREVLKNIDECYRNGITANPISPAALRLSFNPKRLMAEAKSRSLKGGFFSRAGALLHILLANVVGAFLFKFKVQSESTKWGDYKQKVEENTDYRKFDETLRMILSGNREMREKLVQALEEKYQSGTVAYGLHVGTHAQMTCLVFANQDLHLHFVDGSGGGYTLAAKEMKAKLKKLEQGS